jgi:hypothetical protein
VRPLRDEGVDPITPALRVSSPTNKTISQLGLSNNCTIQNVLFDNNVLQIGDASKTLAL